MSEIVNLLFLTAFLSFLPSPRLRLYEETIVLVTTHGIGALFVLAQVLEPVLSLLKIGFQSKLISWAIAISTVAPRMGKHVLSREVGVWRIRHVFDRRVGDEMLQFRRDLRQMYITNSEMSGRSPGKGSLLADIKRTHSTIQRQHTVGEILIGVLVGIAALIASRISLLAGVGLLLSLYLLIFPVSMALRSIIVDTLAFPVEMVDVEDEAIQYPPRAATLRFMQGWNRMLLQNEAIIHKLILLSFIKGEFVLGYERGEELIESVLTGELELEEAFDNLVAETLEEETTKARWTRRLVKRFLGV